jgi:hypothetical protein
VGVAVNQSGSNTAAGVISIAVAISASLLAGFPTYIAVKSETADVHVWPAGWTVLFTQPCDGGYFSVATRIRVAGDSNTVTVTNGGHATNWAASYVGWKTTGNATSLAEPNFNGAVTVAGTAIAIPALPAGTPDSFTLAVFASVKSTLPAANMYPFAQVIGGNGNAPAILQLPQHADAGSPAYTLQRTDVATTGVFATLIDDGGLGYQANLIADAQRTAQRGYNGYAPTQESYGGSIQVVRI